MCPLIDYLLGYHWWDPDGYLKHLFFGTLIYFLGRLIRLKPKTAVVVALLVGIAKEVWDYSLENPVDVWDVVCTVAIPVIVVVVKSLL